jgi:hypothetical protein
VVDVGHRVFSLQVMVSADMPNRDTGAANEYEKQSLGDLGFGQVFLCKVVFALSDPAVDKRNILRLA